MSGTVRLERLGIPVVLAIAGGFEKDAYSACFAHGMPTLRQVVVPGYVWGRQPREDKIPLAEAAFERLIEAMTRPLTSEEQKPEPQKASLEPVEISADNYELVVEQFNEMALDKRWGDGLPLIPPTEEKVKWMLSGTNRSLDEIIGKVSPSGGVATIEKIAISAVMAGAKPEYLPVIIAAMEGLTDPDFDLLHVQASTGNFTPAIFVSGPIANEINMNSGIGYLGHGFRANNTIGRSIRLCLTNLGHAWPGASDMAVIGRPSPHTFYTFAENSEFSPWEPYHTGRGFKKNDSCVTVSTVGSYGGYSVNQVSGRTVQVVLNEIVQGMTRLRRIFTLFKRGVANPMAHWSKHIIMVYPQAANQLNSLGFNQERLENYLYERISIPFEEMLPDEVNSLKERIRGSRDGDMLLADTIPPDRISFFEESLKPGGRIPVLISPKDIHIVVSGSGTGVPGAVVWMSYIKAVYEWTSHQTKKISGAVLTKEGR